MRDAAPPTHGPDRVALAEMINRVVDKGVVLSGELTISVAEVDLLFVGLRVLLCGADRLSDPVVLRSRTAALPAAGGSAR